MPQGGDRFVPEELRLTLGPAAVQAGTEGWEGIEWINLIGSNSFIQFVYIGILLLHGPFNASLWFNILYHILKYFHHFFN